jgi:hypothetical protein
MSKSVKSIIKDIDTADLDFEIGRRRAFPPCLSFFPGREEYLTVSELLKEFEATPLDFPDREWRRWELALAARQKQLTGKDIFYRVNHYADEQETVAAE